LIDHLRWCKSTDCDEAVIAAFLNDLIFVVHGACLLLMEECLVLLLSFDEGFFEEVCILAVGESNSKS